MSRETTAIKKEFYAAISKAAEIAIAKLKRLPRKTQRQHDEVYDAMGHVGSATEEYTNATRDKIIEFDDQLEAEHLERLQKKLKKGRRL